jgi:hypothetical protein
MKVKMHVEAMCKVATNIQGKLKFEVINIGVLHWCTLLVMIDYLDDKKICI